jgi:hypothetical protein
MGKSIDPDADNANGPKMNLAGVRQDETLKGSSNGAWKPVLKGNGSLPSGARIDALF